MQLGRFFRHVMMSPLAARRCFPPSSLDAIQREIAALEKTHRGEVAFVVEAELSTAQLWRELGPRERAREVFAAQGVWNTAENNGVVIYVLLADRRVEIVADRGIDARVQPEEWSAICRLMEGHLRERRFEQGAIEGVRAVSALLARHFPPSGTDANEIGDRPVMI